MNIKQSIYFHLKKEQKKAILIFPVLYSEKNE